MSWDAMIQDSRLQQRRELARKSKTALIDYIIEARERAEAALVTVEAHGDRGYASGALNSVAAVLDVPTARPVPTRQPRPEPVVWCYCFESPEPDGPWGFPSDWHADVCQPTDREIGDQP